MPDLALTHRTYGARAGAAPHPTLVMLHGLGSNEMDLLSMAPFTDPRLLVISVRAPFSYPGFPGGFMWYDLQQGPGLEGEMIHTSLDLLQRFLSEVVEHYGADPQQIYLGGFSQGAAMSGALALLAPERLAGAIMLSGYLPPDSGDRYRPQQAAGKPFFQGHGTLDPVVPVAYARMTRDFLATTPVDLTYREYPMGHEVSEQEIRDLSVWFSAVLDRAAVGP